MAGISAMTPAWAADGAPVEARVDRLEKEMRAVQRKVFPAGVPVQPDIVTQPTVSQALPSSTPVSDLMARVNSLESQLASITGQVEQNSYKLKQLEDRLEQMKAQAGSAPLAAAPAASAPAKPAASGAPKVAQTEASETRKAVVGAIERPSTGDAANDAYVYGFRLWEAKFYPEAQEQLKATVEKYGTASVGSRAQNLLGRAYLDDGKPALASVAFYENYQKRPTGDRAAQSLAYLGDALIQLKKPADACKVYGELESSYGATLGSDLRSMMEKGRTRAKCGA
ncbi:MAG: hypothetical protein AB7E05_11460 [Sphingobium sp.]